jgi:hypothetical protein
MTEYIIAFVLGVLVGYYILNVVQGVGIAMLLKFLNSGDDEKKNKDRFKELLKQKIEESKK